MLPYHDPNASPEGAVPARPSASWQQPMQQLAPLPPLPPGEIGWMGAPAGWQQGSTAWAYGQAGAWDFSAAVPSYAQPQVEYVAQAQAQPAGGVVFLCDPRTEDECLQRCLLGLPASQAQIVRTIVPEQSLLFLFNVRPVPCPGVTLSCIICSEVCTAAACTAAGPHALPFRRLPGGHVAAREH